MINLQNYITASKLFKTFIVDDLLVVEYKCLVEDDQSDIWAHDNYFAYVIGGEKKWKTPSREVTADSGDILFVRKGANTVYQYFQEEFLVIFIFVSDKFLRNILLKYRELIQIDNKAGHDFSIVPVAKNDLLTSFFKSVNIYFSRKTDPPSELLKLKTEELILGILTQPGNYLMKQFFHYLLNNGRNDLKEIMNANYSNHFTIKEYAALCNRSLSSFRRDFVKEFGAHPGKWILEKRLALSRFLLETTTDRINEIAYAAGFRNRTHFNKAFLTGTGLSPNQYRQELQAAKLAVNS